MTEGPRAPVEFRRELGLLDATVVVAGAIIGVGIFVNPGNVARILGDASSIDSIDITWPSGRVDSAVSLPADRFYVAREGAAVTVERTASGR